VRKLFMVIAIIGVGAYAIKKAIEPVMIARLRSGIEPHSYRIESGKE